jgi:single-stranded DNA-binding protein
MRYLMKVPALNVAHVCGTVTSVPAALPMSNKPAGAIFELSARTYERGRRTISVQVTVVCWAAVAEAVLARVRKGDVVLITGALQNHHSDRSSLSVVASAVQFLTAEEITPNQSE